MATVANQLENATETPRLVDSLNLFSPIPTQTAVQNSKYARAYPANALTNDGPIEIRIPAQGGVFIDPSCMFLEISGRVGWRNYPNVKAAYGVQTAEALIEMPSVPSHQVPNATIVNGATFTHATIEYKWMPVQAVTVDNPVHSLFSSIEVYLNARLIGSQDALNPYKGYITKILTQDEPTQKTQEAASGFYYDHYQDAKDGLTNTKKEFGLYRRFFQQSYSKTVTYCDRLFTVDLCNQARVLPTAVELQFVLRRTPPEFYMIQSERHKDYDMAFHIDRCVLVYKIIEPASATLVAMEAHLAKEAIKIFYPRTEMKSVSVNKGQTLIVVDSLYCGSSLPSKVILGITETERMRGTRTKSPFVIFHHFVESVELTHDGELTAYGLLKFKYNTKRYTDQNYMVAEEEGTLAHEENDNYAMAYYFLLESLQLNRMERSGSTMITADRYRRDSHWIVFDLSPDLSTSGALNVPRAGNLRLSIQLSEAARSNLSLIVLGQHDSTIVIDQMREVRASYGV